MPKKSPKTGFPRRAYAVSHVGDYIRQRRVGDIREVVLLGPASGTRWLRYHEVGEPSEGGHLPEKYAYPDMESAKAAARAAVESRVAALQREIERLTAAVAEGIARLEELR